MLRAHPVLGKQKCVDICTAFIAGAPKDAEGAVFYGVDESNRGAWDDAKTRGDVYYLDNAFFDACRQNYFRATKNGVQPKATRTSDVTRFAELGMAIHPWRKRGSHVVVCQQSDSFMRSVVGYRGDWVADTIVKLAEQTERSLLIRLWSANKGRQAASLLDDLHGAHALIAHSSAAAITALLHGIPVAVDRMSVAYPMGGSLDDIEHLPMPDREAWAASLADQQWTLDEFRSGLAWDMLNG